MSEIYGDTTGLKPSQLKLLERIYRRKLDADEFAPPELVRALTETSHEIGRQVGVLISRAGAISHVVVGSAHRLDLPDFGRARSGRGRFRGLRLLHTHLGGEPLSHDDLTDLALLRLDLCLMVQVGQTGLPMEGAYAYLLPPNSRGETWKIEPFKTVHQIGRSFQDFIYALEEEFSKATSGIEADQREKASVVGVAKRGDKRAPDSLGELERLADAAGLHVIDRVLQYRHEIDPKYVTGKGKLEEVVIRAMQAGADVIIFDQDLRPSQLRSISDRTDLKVLDRTQLILDIFAQRATSRAGKLQVEQAQMRYLMPRLGIMNTAMSRLTGGIGGRGPGETKLEINKRRAKDRLTRLSRELESLSAERDLRRRSREKSGLPVVAIVGYTNAGKSTLLNRLTLSDVLAEDRLFATLDPVSRRLKFPEERQIILTDTVGFIRQLPQDLVDAFKSTLEEVVVANLLIHLVDASDPDPEGQMQAVEKILTDLEVQDTERLVVLNKIDLAPVGQVERLQRMYQGIPVSAVTGEGLEVLLSAIERAIWRPRSQAITDIQRAEIETSFPG